AEVRQGVLEPEPLHLSRLREDAASLGLADGLDDGGGHLNVLARDQVDLPGQVAGAGRETGASAKEEHALADRDLVARLQQDVLDRLAVDEGAVGAAAVHQADAVGRAAEFSVT